MQKFGCLLLLAWIASVAGSSGCDQCASGGSCQLAYRNTPGHFCGRWIYNGLTYPCCCPTGAYCHVGTSYCRCRAKAKTSKSIPFWYFVLAFFGVFSCCFLGCLCFRNNSKSMESYEYSEIKGSGAPPVVYGVGPQYTDPTPTAVYVQQPMSGGGNGAVVGGAVAGLATGALIGAALTSHDDGGGVVTVEEDFGGDGGPDFMGDDGGDFGGDDGGDFGGDDGGDFGGDV